MTTVQITLPDQLAQEAQSAGLLTSATIERMLREQLKTRHGDELFAAMDRMVAVDTGDIKALTFDVFGTCVDFRGSLIRDCRAWGKAKGLRVNWARFSDAWRAGYRPAMDRVTRVSAHDSELAGAASSLPPSPSRYWMDGGHA